MHLYGLDSKLKHIQNKFSNFDNIFKKIDKMPMRVKELNSKDYKPVKKNKYTLYSDDNPRSTIQGTGFKDKERALKTIKIVKKLKDPKKAFQIINTMYFRARHHPNRTKNMELAMKIFKKWLDNYKVKNK